MHLPIKLKIMENINSIAREQLKEKIENDEDFVLIDVLGPKSYSQIHLPNAINLPIESENFIKRIGKELDDKGKEIIVYCGSYSCHLSSAATKKLVKAGYSNVTEYDGGLKDWAAAGYPFEGDNIEQRKEALLGE